ncbi:MAG: energy transducer TonB [Gemmatimonadota bacterium]
MIRTITTSIGVCIAAALLSAPSTAGSVAINRARPCVNFPVDRRAEARVDSMHRLYPLPLPSGRLERKHWPNNWESFYHKVTLSLTVDSTGRVVTGSVEVLQESEVPIGNQACKAVQRMRFAPRKDDNGYPVSTTRFTDVRFPSFNGRW